jgi:CYTH domain-containing protein
MQEIERKFLVNSSQFKKEATSSFEIAQGYLNTHPQRSVRIRIKGDEGFLTIKGKSSESGTSRFEWETAIPIAEAKQLLQLCEKGIIEKIRYNIPKGNHVFEVDEFFGENEGLIVAEVELQHEDEVFQKPTWLAEEVTGQIPYYNAQLSKKPYKTWHHE